MEVKVLDGMKAAVAAFFDLSLEEKKRYAMPENDLQGYGQAYVVSEQQKLDWGDLIFLMTRPIEDRNMKYWPTAVPGFKYVTPSVLSFCVKKITPNQRFVKFADAIARLTIGRD